MKLWLAWMAGAAIMATPIVAAEGGVDLGGGMALDGLLVPLSNLGGMGFVVWFAWYTITRTLPSMTERFDVGLERAFAEAKRAREEFHNELLTIIESHRQCAAEHRAAVDKLGEAVREMVRGCAARQKVEM